MPTFANDDMPYCGCLCTEVLVCMDHVPQRVIVRLQRGHMQNNNYSLTSQHRRGSVWVAKRKKRAGKIPWDGEVQYLDTAQSRREVSLAASCSDAASDIEPEPLELGFIFRRRRRSRGSSGRIVTSCRAGAVMLAPARIWIAGHMAGAELWCSTARGSSPPIAGAVRNAMVSCPEEVQIKQN